MKLYLRDEFTRLVGMTVPELYFSFPQKISFDEGKKITYINSFILSWYSGGGITIRRLCWRSKSVKNYSGKEELLVDDVEIWQEGLEHWVPMLREKIPKMFRKHFWTGYRFIVEIKSMGMDTLLEIDAPKEDSEKLLSYLDESVAKWNEEENGLIHNVFPIKSRSKNLKFRIDTGSSGELGIKRIIEDLDKSSFIISKIIISDAN